MASPRPRPRLRLKRVYAPAEPGDGTRVLVDRLWPRGLAKSDAAIDHWLKDLAPSNELRRWFGHDPARWAEFRRRYEAELRRNPAPLAELRALMRKGPLTLLYGAHDEHHNQAVVLGQILTRRRTAVKSAPSGRRAGRR